MTPVAMTATGFTVIFAATSLGSALVLFFKKDISPKVNTAFLVFASGVMIAASVWSLIIPSIEASENYGKWSFLPAAVGFIAAMAARIRGRSDDFCRD